MKDEDEIQLVHDKLSTLLEDEEVNIMVTILRPQVGIEMRLIRATLCWVLNHGGEFSKHLEQNVKFMDEFFENMGIEFNKEKPIVH